MAAQAQAQEDGDWMSQASLDPRLTGTIWQHSGPGQPRSFYKPLGLDIEPPTVRLPYTCLVRPGWAHTASFVFVLVFWEALFFCFEGDF